jgi:phospholipase C
LTHTETCTVLPPVNSQGQTTGNCLGKTIPLYNAFFYTTYDIGHTHEDFQDMWNGGATNGASTEYYPGSPTPCSSNPKPFAYVQNGTTNGIADDPPNEVQPYFDIAKAYGFANYMFQTNQGPSFPAHQFLFSGTSAPVYNDRDTSQYWRWFAADNPKLNGSNAQYSGCLSASGTTVKEVNYTDTVHELAGYTPPSTEISGAIAGYPCYNHNSIADVLAANGKTWSYYTTDRTSLWTAPNAIWGICGATTVGLLNCPNTIEWPNVIQENYPVNHHAAKILEDIQSASCSLPNVVFVTPDGQWSDHAGSNNPPALGPAWVAAIVNAIGSSTCLSANGLSYWKSTVILVTWDDWGGWYDHVSPPFVGYRANGQSAGSGGKYVYGFRVPLLVVSAYSPKKGYISGSGATGTTCPTSPTTRYCHDFGSILNFIEWVFGSAGHSLGQIYGTYPFADYYALDGPTNCLTCTYSLADFFNFNNSATNFTYINPTVGSDGTVYDATYFINYTGVPQPPDED